MTANTYKIVYNCSDVYQMQARKKLLDFGLKPGKRRNGPMVNNMKFKFCFQIK